MPVAQFGIVCCRWRLGATTHAMNWLAAGRRPARGAWRRVGDGRVVVVGGAAPATSGLAAARRRARGGWRRGGAAIVVG